MGPHHRPAGRIVARQLPRRAIQFVAKAFAVLQGPCHELVGRQDPPILQEFVSHHATNSRCSLWRRCEGPINNILKIFHHQLDLAKTHFPDRFFVLNYTALTEDPHRTIEEMFYFFGDAMGSLLSHQRRVQSKGTIDGTATRARFKRFPELLQRLCHESSNPPLRVLRSSVLLVLAVLLY